MTDAYVTNATGGLFDTELYVHHALDDLHEAGFSDASFAVVGQEVRQVDMRHNDSTVDNMVPDGEKLRRWGQTPEQWHFQNGDEGIMLATTYQNEGQQGLRDALVQLGLDEERADTLASGVDDGLTLVVVHNIQAEEIDRARGILIQHGASTAS